MENKMVFGFIPKHPIVQDLCNGFWKLHEPLFYDASDYRSWMIPRGFITDFGSVPKIVDCIIPAIESVADPAYILHDYLYGMHRKGDDRCNGRDDADNILYEALRICGVGRIKAGTIYYAVRCFGSFAWNRKEDNK